MSKRAVIVVDIQNEYFASGKLPLVNIEQAAAKAAQVPSVSRDVFLDNQRTEAEIDYEFALAVAKARKDGAAVLIGHPYPETVRYLERRLPQLEGEGVRLVSVQALLER